MPGTAVPPVPGPGPALVPVDWFLLRAQVNHHRGAISYPSLRLGQSVLKSSTADNLSFDRNSTFESGD